MVAKIAVISYNLFLIFNNNEQLLMSWNTNTALHPHIGSPMGFHSDQLSNLPSENFHILALSVLLHCSPRPPQSTSLPPRKPTHDLQWAEGRPFTLITGIQQERLKALGGWSAIRERLQGREREINSTSTSDLWSKPLRSLIRSSSVVLLAGWGVFGRIWAKS